MHPLIADQSSGLRPWLVSALRPLIDHGDYELAGGGRSDWYLDCRPLLYGIGGMTVAHMVDDVLDAFVVDAIGGVGFGGLPVGLQAAQIRDLPSFAVRLEPKGHGQVGKVVGAVEPGNRVALVEDVFTTGSSVCSAIEALRGAEITVAAVVCVLNRGNPTQRTVSGDVPFFSLVTADDLEER